MCIRDRDYRPGMRAAEELGVRSPLMEVGFTKDEERELLRAWGYPVWNLPAGACLATRVPTGEELTREKVDLIRACEDYLHDLDLAQVRARLIGGCMHIEAAPADVAKIAALGGNAVDAEGKTPLPAVIESPFPTCVTICLLQSVSIRNFSVLFTLLSSCSRVIILLL